MVRFETVYMHRKNKLARQIAELFAFEIYGADGCNLDDEIDSLIDLKSDKEDIEYALLDPNGLLLAGANVIHNHESKPITDLVCIAVIPEYQNSGFGYGTEMMKFVARQAIAKGDTRIKLNCYNEDIRKGFYSGLGFEPTIPSLPAELSINAFELASSKTIQDAA